MSTPRTVTSKALRTTLMGIVVNALFVLAKALGGIFGHSYALIADAIESASDVFSSTMLWLGLKWSARPADDNHPYGHGKAEALMALGISIALVLAAGFIVRDSIRHIIEPHQTPAPYTLLILIAVVIIKEVLFRFVLKTGSDINSHVVKADAFHHRSDAITSAAAFVGISIALIGGKGYEVADDYAALVAVIFIVYNAYGIARPAIGELLDEAMEPEVQTEIIETALQVTEVKHVQKCYTRKMGTGYHVDLHIWIDGKLSVTDGHTIAHEVKDKIMIKMPNVLDVHIHVEPSASSH